MKHTQEPWVYEAQSHYNARAICDRAGFRIFEAFDLNDTGFIEGLGEVNLKRAATCVNACEGLDDPAVEIAKLQSDKAALLGASKSGLRALRDNLDPGPMDIDAIEGLKAAIGVAEAIPA